MHTTITTIQHSAVSLINKIKKNNILQTLKKQSTITVRLYEFLHKIGSQLINYK